jgi:hypothetical protein
LCPIWVFWLSAFRSPPPEVGPLRVLTASFFHRHLPQQCSGQIAPEHSLVDHSTFCFMFYLVFLYFVFFVLFCFDFPLYSVFVGFSCICFSIFLYCFSVCFVCFLVFTVLPIFSTPFATLRPLLGLFPRPHHVERPTHPSVYEICLHVIGVKE